jgi:hypothetical protein
MTPKEKAIELVYKMNCQRYMSLDSSKQCALIAVDETLNLMVKHFKWDIKNNGNIQFWQEVKQEIENL